MEKIKYTGLTSHAALGKLNKYGYNILMKKKKRPLILVFLSQFTDIMVIILLICACISAVMSDILESLVMIGIVVINAILGFIQEVRTEKTIEMLRKLTAMKASVLRDGKVTELDAIYIVPGDLIFLKAGDIIPADGFIAESPGISIDESMLTGESVSVFKSSDGDNAVYAGSVVTGGSAKVGVTETGMHTQMGHISDMLQNVKEDMTPLQKRLSKLGRYIVICCLTVCAAVTGLGILKGEPIFEMLISGISLAVAAVPEGLPALITISLALGVSRMAGKNALVRRLNAVETLGNVNVICSDKTGTLTQNKMTLRRSITVSNMLLGSDNAEERTYMSLVCKHCNNLSDPTEIALSELGNICNDVYYERIYEIPFDSARKCMSVIVKDRQGTILLLTKGGGDVILDKCQYYKSGQQSKIMGTETKRKFEEELSIMASEALRVLAFAFRKLSFNELESIKKGAGQSSLERRLCFIGYAGMIDPPRPEVPLAINTCKTAGIRTIMITGDNSITAAAIACELGIINNISEGIMSGHDIESMSNNDLARSVCNCSVFARVLPAHKLRIVRALKESGSVVAMTGDGVNDAPAVKESDIGIAMGINGTDVTKEASSMILMDDNFATIVEAVRQGRAIYSNIRKFIRYMLSCNLGEVLTMFIGIIIGIPLPLFPIQILWVNLVTDGLPGIALGLDPADSDIMERPPIEKDSGVFSGHMKFHILFRGFLIGACTLGSFLAVQGLGGSIESCRTTAFLTLVTTQIVHSFECRSETKCLFEIDIRENMWLLATAGISLLMMLSVIYIPILQIVFKTVPLSISYLGVSLCATAIGPILGSIFSRKRLR